MTAKEKFMERAKELGVCMESDGTLHAGFEIDDRIVVLVANGQGGYFEYHYPTFKTLKELEGFPEACMKHWINNGDDKFTIEVAEWLFNDGECPLYALDVYYINDDFDCRGVEIKFMDDEEPKGFGDIMDTLNNHDEKLVERINELYNERGALEFMLAIISLYGNLPYDELETVDRQLYEKIQMKEFVYEVLEHWSADKELREIIGFIEEDGHGMLPFYDSDGNLLGSLY